MICEQERGGGGGKQQLQDSMEQHCTLFCTFRPMGTKISSVDEVWLVKRKEQTLYWVLNELLTNVYLSIT